MSDSDDLSSEKPEKKENLSRQKSNRSIERQVSNVSSIKPRVQPPPPPPPPPQIIEDSTGLYEENRKLRRKLKELSVRLDEELERAAANKLKKGKQVNGHPVTLQSHSLELQNAYKMIERLQKTVHDYESKESYQVTLKRVMDLQGIIRKKEAEVEELKTEVKTQKKLAKEKQRHIEELIENSKKMNNPAEDLELINKLKNKLKKTLEDNELLRRKQLEKHEKLVKAERRLVEIEQSDKEHPIGREEDLLKEIQDFKNKYKEAMQRVERQNIYISKLNEKRQKEPPASHRRSQPQSERSSLARSLQELPDVKKKIPTSELLEHLPSPKLPLKLRRY